MITPESFWNTFRPLIANECREHPRALDDKKDVKWTPCVIRAAETACRQLDPKLAIRSHLSGGEVSVPWYCPWERKDKRSGLDVSARVSGCTRFAVAFESEQGPVRAGVSPVKTWKQEFAKLCAVDAELRVLSAYFMPGESPSFEGVLRKTIREICAVVPKQVAGSWLLIFGSYDSSKEPNVPWLPFHYRMDCSIDRDSLSLIAAPLLRPRLVARGMEIHETTH